MQIEESTKLSKLETEKFVQSFRKSNEKMSDLIYKILTEQENK